MYKFNSLVCYLLEKYSSDLIKEKYLKSLAKGDKLGAFSLSEPQSGSDASNMNTFARKDGKNYIVNGTKNWVTNGINSDLVILFAMTEKDIGHRGISCFIISIHSTVKVIFQFSSEIPLYFYQYKKLNALPRQRVTVSI